MTTPKSYKPCYIPLNFSSQANCENVLYYNANATLEDIFDCTASRIVAVKDLLEHLCDYPKANCGALGAVAVVTSILLNDAYTLLQELDPVAVKIRAENDDEASLLQILYVIKR